MDRDGSAAPARRAGKFQPKSSARRSQNQREQEEQAEAARKQQRQIEAERAAARQANRRGLSRARGNGHFRGGLSSWQNESQATGFLGSAVAGTSAESILAAGYLSDSEPVSRGPLRSRQEADAVPTRNTRSRIAAANHPVSLQIKQEENRIATAYGREDLDTQYDIDIDNLAYNNLISDEETEDKSLPRKVLYPVRLKRKADHDKKTTSETKDDPNDAEENQQEATAGSASVSQQRKIGNDDDDDLEVTRTVDVGKRRNRTRQGRQSQIKEEEDTKPDISAESSVHARDYINVSDDDAPENALAQPVTLNSKQTLFSKPILQTAEDHEEWQRYQTDMRAIAEELGPDDNHVPGQSSVAAAKQKESKGRRDEKVYLLQLPPVMPNLQADTSMVLAEPNPITHAGTQEAPVKVEDETGAGEAEPSKLELALNASTKSKFKGRIGTLTVYKGGSTVLDWGGIEFRLERGMSGMLQEALLVNDESSVAYSMSQVAATFIVKPNWDSLFEAKV